jgi:inosine-uridine nucleoside N-ribohydrolase
MLNDDKDSNPSVPIWIDCDPGHDDAMAIILALFTKEIELLGISTVSGNSTIEKTTMNAINVLNMCGLIESKQDSNEQTCNLFNSKQFGIVVPILKGRKNPLIRAPMICKEIHGNS